MEGEAMNREDEEDKARVAVAQMILKLADNWVQELQIIAVRARMTKARYDALRKVGFDSRDALILCTKTLEL
jgi:hypothetical protein